MSVCVPVILVSGVTCLLQHAVLFYMEFDSLEHELFQIVVTYVAVPSHVVKHSGQIGPAFAVMIWIKTLNQFGQPGLFLILLIVLLFS